MEYIKDQKEKEAIKYTLPGWESSGKSWTDYAIPGHEICISLWEYFLSVVPPILKARGFLVSEPYRQVDGVFEYMAFVRDRDWDKYYYVGIIPERVFNRKYVTKG